MKKIFKFNMGENKITFSKIKGYWSCNEITIYCNDPFDGAMLMDKVIDVVDIILLEKNKGAVNEDKI